MAFLEHAMHSLASIAQLPCTCMQTGCLEESLILIQALPKQLCRAEVGSSKPPHVKVVGKMPVWVNKEGVPRCSPDQSDGCRNILC